jgi:hypothetical protein
MAREVLLPPNRTAFEAAADLTGARIDELPVDLPKLVRPYEIPAPHLPWLAWGLSVDLWDPDWPEDKRRVLTARSLPMHARKGTAASIAEHIRVMGAEPRRFIVPPAKTFMVPAYTAEERAAYLQRFAQLRVYPHVVRGTYWFAHFTNKAFGREKAYLGACVVKDVGAWSRFVRTARLWDRGVETTLTMRVVTAEGLGRFHAAAYDEVILASKPTAAVHLNAPPKAKIFLVDDFGVRQRVIRIPRDDSYEYRLGRETYTTAWPNAELIDVRPEAVAEAHPGQPTALYATRRQAIAGKCLPPTIAWRYLYERWHIHDPDRVPDERKRATHLGFTRLGMPPYHAEVQTRITGHRPPRTAGLFVNGHLVSGDRKPIADVREAIRVSKALRDRILIDTRTWRSPRAGDRLPVGGSTLGQLIEV